jgi:hypothetical protein
LTKSNSSSSSKKEVGAIPEEESFLFRGRELYINDGNSLKRADRTEGVKVTHNPKRINDPTWGDAGNDYYVDKICKRSRLYVNDVCWIIQWWNNLKPSERVHPLMRKVAHEVRWLVKPTTPQSTWSSAMRGFWSSLNFSIRKSKIANPSFC